MLGLAREGIEQTQDGQERTRMQRLEQQLTDLSVRLAREEKDYSERVSHLLLQSREREREAIALREQEKIRREEQEREFRETLDEVLQTRTAPLTTRADSAATVRSTAPISASSSLPTTERTHLVEVTDISSFIERESRLSEMLRHDPPQDELGTFPIRFRAGGGGSARIALSDRDQAALDLCVREGMEEEVRIHGWISGIESSAGIIEHLIRGAFYRGLRDQK
jgi:hypothetical protein